MIRGYVENLRAFQVRGWAYDISAVGQHVVVELRAGADVLGNAVADQFRSDLAAAGVGDGAHGFVINVDKTLPTDDPEKLGVFVRIDQQRAVRLPLADTFQIESVQVSRDNPAEPDSHAVGYFSINDGVVAGWAYDTQAPSVPLKIQIRAAEETITELVAAQFRPDLVAVCEGHAEHGFTYSIKEDLMAPARAIVAYAEDVSGRQRKLTLVRPVAEASNRTAVAPTPSGPILRFPRSAFDSDQRPVFVLGAARSGTSAMTQGLLTATRYKGPEEGHFLDLAPQLLSLVDRFYVARAEEWAARDSTLIAMAPKDFVSDGVKQIFVEFCRLAFPTRMWSDKTPRFEMIAAAPLMQEIFPNARFVFMKRRGIENVASRLRKFPNLSFAQHCRDWVACMNTWVSVRDRLGTAALEVDQLELATDPGGVAETLAKGIDLTSTEQRQLARAFSEDKPERTSQNLTSPSAIDAYGWSAEDVATFVALCGDAMAEHHYAMGEEYFSASPSSGWGKYSG